MSALTPEALFGLANPLALLGWLILLASPFIPRAANILSGFVIPGVLSVLYVALVLVYFADAEGGYGTLPDVMALFDSPGVALAGWVHYLAFDLFIGAWIVRHGRKAGVHFGLILPCLPAAFMFGPAGLVLYGAIYAGLRFVRGPQLAEV